jgi:hypothetical protein
LEPFRSNNTEREVKLGTGQKLRKYGSLSELQDIDKKPVRRRPPHFHVGQPQTPAFIYMITN